LRHNSPQHSQSLCKINLDQVKVAIMNISVIKTDLSTLFKLTNEDVYPFHSYIVGKCMEY